MGRLFLYFYLIFFSLLAEIAYSQEESSYYAELNNFLLKNKLDYSWDNLSRRVFLKYSGKLIVISSSSNLIFIDDLVINCERSIAYETGKLFVPWNCLEILKEKIGLTVYTEKVELNKKPRAEGRRKLLKIILDPGHGGFDGGTVHDSVKEKDLVFEIALLVKALLKGEEGFQVYLTRVGDYFLDLEERTKIANSSEADLFISLHANSGERAEARGFEIFVLSSDSSDFKVRLLAKHENKYFSFGDNSSGVNLILSELTVGKFRNQSQILANLVNWSFIQSLNTENRGVKEAPFYVLYDLNMPSILVELGFVSNEEERGRLQNPVYQKKYAESLIRAIKIYKEKIIN